MLAPDGGFRNPGCWGRLSTGHGFRHPGSKLNECFVYCRSLRMARPYVVIASVESFAPGGSSSIDGCMNLSGKPGIVQPMHTPPTFGQPPTPPIQPRLPTLHCTTGPQQPTFTRHFGEP